MNKLRLDIDTLVVQSFRTAEAAESAAEVRLDPTIQFTFCYTDCRCPNTQ